MYLGKKVRLERIINRENGRTIIVPMDHGVTLGAVEGLIDMREAVNDMAMGGADAVLMHKGLVRCSHRNAGKDVGLIVHLSASTALSPSATPKPWWAPWKKASSTARIASPCTSTWATPTSA